jgi:ankyrin repeat protein
MEKRKGRIREAFAAIRKRPFRRLVSRLTETRKRINARLLKFGLGFPDMIDSVPDRLGRIMEGNNTKLIRAAVDGDTARMKRLIRKGAYVNIMVEFGKVSAPLIHYCALNDAYPQLSVLLDNGADPDIRDARGMTALMYAAGHGSYSMCCALLADMLAKGKDINAADNEGMTALMHAAAHEKDDACVLILWRGAADPYVRDKDGRIAYGFARNSMTKKAIARNALGMALASPFLEQMFGKPPIDFKYHFLQCIGYG